ncbi:MAG: hypothetical protein HYT30_01375 [Parcubacteria group bacterium]|nr:hypothetical protein [Parcubacteria group bacterium]
MGKRGPKPKGKVKIRWSADFAYAIGLLVADGCLSPSGRHIILVSKDEEQLHNFKKALAIDAHITNSYPLATKIRRIQFGDVLFYQFLLSIGLIPNKSKVIGKIQIPKKYFFDFLRGSFDGDGSSYSYFDPRWQSSFMFYTCFVSASKTHLDWLQEEIFSRLGVSGHITHTKSNTFHQLKYAKKDSLKVLRKMYHSNKVTCLSRKRLKIDKMLDIVGERL